VAGSVVVRPAGNYLPGVVLATTDGIEVVSAERTLDRVVAVATNIYDDLLVVDVATIRGEIVATAPTPTGSTTARGRSLAPLGSPRATAAKSTLPSVQYRWCFAPRTLAARCCRSRNWRSVPLGSPVVWISTRSSNGLSPISRPGSARSRISALNCRAPRAGTYFLQSELRPSASVRSCRSPSTGIPPPLIGGPRPSAASGASTYRLPSLNLIRRPGPMLMVRTMTVGPLSWWSGPKRHRRGPWCR